MYLISKSKDYSQWHYYHCPIWWPGPGKRGQYHSHPLHHSATTRANLSCSNYQLGLFDSFDDVPPKTKYFHHENISLRQWRRAATGGRRQPVRVCYETQGTSDTHHWCLGMLALTWPFISTQTSTYVGLRSAGLDHDHFKVYDSAHSLSDNSTKLYNLKGKIFVGIFLKTLGKF